MTEENVVANLKVLRSEFYPISWWETTNNICQNSLYTTVVRNACLRNLTLTLSTVGTDVSSDRFYLSSSTLTFVLLIYQGQSRYNCRCVNVLGSETRNTANYPWTLTFLFHVKNHLSFPTSPDRLWDPFIFLETKQSGGKLLPHSCGW
jgi:hypothetical protein